MKDLPKPGQFVKVLPLQPHHVQHPPHEDYIDKINHVGKVLTSFYSTSPESTNVTVVFNDNEPIFYFSRLSLELATEHDIAMMALAEM